MSKRSALSDPSVVDKARLKRKVDSSASHFDSSSDPCEESDYNLMAPLPLTYAPAAPTLIGPASTVVDDDLTEWRRSFLTGNMSGSAINDPFVAYQEAAKIMSAKKDSTSRTASGDEVIITGSRRATMVKLEPTSSSQGKKSKGGGVTTRSAHQSAGAARYAGGLSVALANLNFKVFPQDGVVLPAGDPSEVVQVLQGGLLQVTSQLYHLKERLSNENLVIDCEELESLKRQVSEEREQRTAPELEICDFKDKVRELEKVAETYSAGALAASQKSQELEEVETLKLEMVMAVNGARIVARWELMREWLNEQSGQWDLSRALDQNKMVVLEEAKNKGDPPPSFEDEPAIPPASEMDVDLSVKP
ncbi:hypothetical protein HID58_087880 [Brassica napus]|uniref:Uncharacterized protein n=1 Tax=Brassica napus TaxID=3708 RepID=A0ABQ7XVY5_BRANA|nr:hypothetical protein HID58_087880 [Brassica napus]